MPGLDERASPFFGFVNRYKGEGKEERRTKKSGAEPDDGRLLWAQRPVYYLIIPDPMEFVNFFLKKSEEIGHFVLIFRHTVCPRREKIILRRAGRRQCRRPGAAGGARTRARS